MTFKFLEVLQLFVKVLSHMWWLYIFQGHLFQAGPEDRQRGKEGMEGPEQAGMIHLEFVESNPCTCM